MRVWLLCVLCSRWAFYDADVSFTVQASSCMAVPAICDHMSRDSRQHCLRTWQHKISCDVCWTVNAGVKLDLDESSSFEKNKKNSGADVSSRCFPFIITVSAAFFTLFFVSYVTQITKAWPLLSVFFFNNFVMKRRTAIAIVVIWCIILGSGCVMCEGWCKRHPSLGISSQQLVSPPLWTSGHTDRFGTPNHCVSHLGLK